MSSSRTRRGKQAAGWDFPTRWSEWEWNIEHQCDIRYRLRSPGEYEFEYGPICEAEPTNRIRLDEITAAVEAYHIDDSYTIDPPPHGRFASRPDADDVACPEPSCSQTFGSTNERDRHYRTAHSNNGGRHYACLREGCPAGVKRWTNPEKLRAHNKKWHGPYSCPESNCSRRFPHGFGSQGELDGHQRSEHGGPPGLLPSSSQGSGLEPISDSEPLDKGKAASSNYTTSTIDTITSDIERGKLQIPSWGYKGEISSSNLNTSQEMDPRFKVHGAWEFQWGRVFKVLWSEPKGDNRANIPGDETDITDASGNESQGPRSKRFFEKVRRFVIIDPRNGHCICLPILTYGGRGTLKPGVHSDDHAQVYASNKPDLAVGETLLKKPIRVKLTHPRERLHPMSRINYAKLYTVEYNVKVCFIGKVHIDSEYRIIADYNTVHPPLASRGLPPSTAEDTYVYAGESATTSYGSYAYPMPQTQFTYGPESFYTTPSADYNSSTPTAYTVPPPLSEASLPNAADASVPSSSQELESSHSIVSK